jgi:hypothetical protein
MTNRMPKKPIILYLTFVEKIRLIRLTKMVEAPGYFLIKRTISPLQFELDQTCKLYFVYLILTNRMQQTARPYL